MSTSERDLAYKKKWRQRNPDYFKSYYQKNKESIRARIRRNYFLKQYGLTEDQLSEMFESQGGVCAICGKACDVLASLYVDHCHETGDVRGLLCQRCNTALGLLRDDIGVLARAFQYLSAHQIEGVSR